MRWDCTAVIIYTCVQKEGYSKREIWK
jgi:hypothetical protein